MIVSGDDIHIWSCPHDATDYDISKLCQEDDYEIDITWIAHIECLHKQGITYTATLNPFTRDKILVFTKT